MEIEITDFGAEKRGRPEARIVVRVRSHDSRSGWMAMRVEPQDPRDRSRGFSRSFLTSMGKEWAGWGRFVHSYVITSPGIYDAEGMVGGMMALQLQVRVFPEGEGSLGVEIESVRLRCREEKNGRNRDCETKGINPPAVGDSPRSEEKGAQSSGVLPDWEEAGLPGEEAGYGQEEGRKGAEAGLSGAMNLSCREGSSSSRGAEGRDPGHANAKSFSSFRNARHPARDSRGHFARSARSAQAPRPGKDLLDLLFPEGSSPGSLPGTEEGKGSKAACGPGEGSEANADVAPGSAPPS